MDWVAKLTILDGYRKRDEMGWDHPRLQLIDLQYSDIRTSKGLAHLLETRGSLERLWPDADVQAAVHEPPSDTRAFFRGTALSRYPDSIAAASWDSVVFDVPGQTALVRVPTLDPWRGTKAHTAEIFNTSPDVAALIGQLSGTAGPMERAGG